MKTIRTHADLDIAPARAIFAAIVKDALTRLVMLYRALRNRRAVMDLEDFTDEQLTDIGLTRRDVDLSLASPWRHDPSAQLARRARRGGATDRRF